MEKLPNSAFELFYEGIEQATNELEVAGRYLQEYAEHAPLWATMEGIRRRLVDTQGEATARHIDDGEAHKEAARQLGQAIWRMGDRKSWEDVRNACALLGVDLPAESAATEPHIRIPDAQGKNRRNTEAAVSRDFLDATGQKSAVSEGDRRHLNTSVPHGETLPNSAPAENKPGAPSKGEPFRVFQTEKELVAFVARMANVVNQSAHDEACKTSREQTKKFAEKQELKRQLLAPGEIYVDSHFLEEAHESISEILERLPDLGGNELTTEINEAAIRVWSRLSMVLRWGAKDHEEEDIDTSDNDAANDAQEGAAQ